MTSNSVKIAAALLAAAFLSAPPQPPAAAQTKAPAKAPEFLFVQTAKDIAYKDGVLTLQDVSPVTVFFSDRPQRIVGHVRNDLFLKKWAEGSNSFKSDPPNAVLSVLNRKRLQQAPSSCSATHALTATTWLTMCGRSRAIFPQRE